MQVSDLELRKFVEAIVANDLEKCSRIIKECPELATAYFRGGATRQNPNVFFLSDIGRYILAGDTALHFAAAAYRTEIARLLIGAGAKVDAKNRHGAEPLHSAAVGQPGSRNWNPDAQSNMLKLLIAAGADPNTRDKRGVMPLHIAVRTRSAIAVETLLRQGADPASKNKSGSTPLKLAKLTTGKSGSGSEAAKLQQKQILRLLEKQAL